MRRRPRVRVTPLVHTADMARQLVLLDTPTDVDWRLDDTTKELGKQGVAAARQALAAAARRTAA